MTDRCWSKSNNTVIYSNYDENFNCHDLQKTVGNKGLDPDADKTGFVQNIRNKGSLTGSETGKCQTRGNPQKANKGQRQENPKPPQETLGALEKAVTKNRNTENDELSRITGKDTDLNI